MITRRETFKLAAMGTCVAALGFGANAQTKRLRLPLDEFVKDSRLLSALHKGVTAMKVRKPSDPLSWFFQASIHGVTDQLWSQEGLEDPGIFGVDRAKYWNQCPHRGQNSANFLPWHRAYTYHFEEILRFHTGLDDFALPYWDYSRPDQRAFPREFGILHLDGNTDNQSPGNLNQLYHAERDFFLCGYEHPYTGELPLTELSARAVDESRALNAPVFFGERENEGLGGGIGDNEHSTRGLLEQSPHDQIHRAVGGLVQGTDGDGNPSFSIGGMAVPPTAGFDPIFPVHHANIDRLWAEWSCMQGKTWGKLPPKEWFDEKPWFFFDVDGEEVNLPRRYYFDYRALGIVFKDEDLTCVPLALPTPETMIAAKESIPLSRISHTLDLDIAFETRESGPTVVPLSVTSGRTLGETMKGAGFARSSGDTMTVILRDLELGSAGAQGYDVFLTPASSEVSALSRDEVSYLGTVSLFNHLPDPLGRLDQSFDATKAMSTNGMEDPIVVIVPFELTTPRGEKPVKTTFISNLRGRGISFVKGAPPESRSHQHE